MNVHGWSVDMGEERRWQHLRVGEVVGHVGVLPSAAVPLPAGVVHHECSLRVAQIVQVEDARVQYQRVRLELVWVPRRKQVDAALLLCQSVRRSVSQSVGRSVSQSVGLSGGRSVGRSVGRLRLCFDR
jgi:hypothetical protein